MTEFKVNKDSLVIEVLLFCLIIYFSQGVVFPTGTLISQIALLLILSLSSYFLLKVIGLGIKQKSFVWGWLCLIFINVIGYLFIYTFNIIDGSYLNSLKSILICTLPFYPFYYFSRKGRLLNSHFIRFFFVMLILSILHFFHEKEMILSARISDREDVVNNAGYYFVMLLPYVFLFKKKILSYLSLFIIILFTIMSAKRGAIITALSGSIIFIYYQIFTQSSKNFIRNMVSATIFFGIMSLYLFNYFMSNDYLITRFNNLSEGGSGRNIIYSNLIDSWYSSDNIINFILGYGFRSSIKYSGTGNVAHNDWLELLINFGLFGFLTYLFVFGSLIFNMFFSKRLSKLDRVIIICITCIWLLISLFSIFYSNTISVFLIILLAYILGNSNKAYQ